MMAFPVVGVGASAGGIEALMEFLAAVQPDVRVAYLLVQHRSPRQASALTELLAAKTTLSVIEPEQGQLIVPQTVYLAPPDAVMTLDDGCLRIAKRSASKVLPGPIDCLFESLAEEEGPNAIGVILSGTGIDGAAGLRAIKTAGGVTFAQNKASSAFFAMPRAAIELDAADHVCSASKIGEAMARLVRHSYFEPESNSTRGEVMPGHLEPTHEWLIRQILVELKVRTGVDFTLYKRGSIGRRLSRRLAVHGVETLKDYLEILKTSRHEAESLVRELLIQVTDFFRDPDVFDGLRRLVLPNLLKDREPQTPIRIWVPGCATGEEVYSIAIQLLEFIGMTENPPPMQLFGTDLSETSIEFARAGIYPETISRHVSPDRLRRYFDRKNGSYRVNSRIRDLCIFARQNVVDDPPFSRLDLISCRNLLIYLDPKLQKKVMKLFHYALRPGGYLLLGPSETVGSSSELFSPTDKRLRIFSKKVIPGRNQTDFSDQITRLGKVHGPRKIMQYLEPSESERFLREADRVAIRRYLPPGVLCDADLNVLEYRGDTSAFITNPNGPPSNHLRRLLKASLLVDLEVMIRKARELNEPVHREGIRVEGAGCFAIEIIPLPTASERMGWFWIFFIQLSADAAAMQPAAEGLGTWLKRGVQRLLTPRATLQQKHTEMLQLARELETTRAYVKEIIEIHEGSLEELKAAEEELLSSNEEFQTTNEELETAQEELQSSNDELRARNRELNTLNEALTQSKEFSESIVEAVFEPLLVLNEDLGIHKANRAFYRTFSLLRTENSEKSLLNRWSGSWFTPEFTACLHRIIPERTSIENQLIEVGLGTSERRQFRVNAQALRWGQDEKILMVLEDITELQTAMHELRQMDQHKDEFMAMLAHELRNPLTPIRNSLEIWRKGVASEEETRKAQETMDRQLTHEARLIDELIDLSRINSGAISLKIERLDLCQIVRLVLQDLTPQAESSGLNLLADVPEAPLMVDGDRIRLAQIVSNLLANSIKFTPEAGTIHVALIREGDLALLKVTDTGVGIEAERMTSLFDLFTQGENTLARSRGGLGIGLNLVRRLVELHQGHVHAFSEGVGKGSVFTVYVPIVKDGGAERLPVEGTAVAQPPACARRILVVDDNVDSAESLSLLMEMEGHQTEVAHDGPEAILRAEQFLPHVILLDIGLPGMDGYAVARHLRSLPNLKQPMLIAISGYGQARDLQKSREAGFDQHLVKPADIQQLKALVATSQGSLTPSHDHDAP